MSVTLSASQQSPAPLGSLVNWTATVAGASPGTLAYRFRVREPNGAFRTVVDYGPNSALAWSAISSEGAYDIEVSVKNRDTGEVAADTQTLALAPLAAGQTPVIAPTAHPLVFIYSAAGCAMGSRMSVQFSSPDGFAQNTPYQSCDPSHTMNFYLAGLRPNTQYTAHHVIDNGARLIAGPSVTLTTPSIALTAPAASMVTNGGLPGTNPVLLQSLIGAPSIATDLGGNIVWYSPDELSFLTRPVAGGTFLGIVEDGTQDPSHQVLREFDLAGVTRAETNAAQVNEQLDARGVHRINAFHHEARKLPDGKYLVLADSERILTGVQGPGSVDVIGDTILVLDSNLEVVWTWDSFDYLDPHRKAIEGESCNYPGGLACAPWYLSPHANDWLHGNSLQLTPDGNILYSTRHQDWLVKIDYSSGTGSGNVIWRLGNGGDFQMVSSDPNPWFSHQHDANFQPGNTELAVFDDGNARAAADPATHSRGQVLDLDERNRVASLVLNADLGTYSAAVGSAQWLSNGNLHFDSGFIRDPSGSGSFMAQSVEVDRTGNIVFGIQFGAMEYRSFRMRDLYTEP